MAYMLIILLIVLMSFAFGLYIGNTNYHESIPTSKFLDKKIGRNKCNVFSPTKNNERQNFIKSLTTD